MNTVTLAPHLQRALETMSKDMGVEEQALVNQAVFAWLRTNGYAATASPALSPSPQQGKGEEPAAAPPQPVRSTPTPAPVVAPPPAAVQPVDVAPLLQRMAEIDADLEKLTKPWPAWAPVQDEEEEEEEEEVEDEVEEEAEEQGESEEESEDSSPHPEPSPEGSGDEEEPVAEEEPLAEDEPPPEEDVRLDGNTGENPFDDGDAGESTIVLRSAPLSLYIERKGYEPVRVDAARFLIGRGPHCNLVIDSPRVSREHVALTRKGVLFVLEDLNSSNGTWLGEDRISIRELETGDEIKLGNEPVTFVIRADD